MTAIKMMDLGQFASISSRKGMNQIARFIGKWRYQELRQKLGTQYTHYGTKIKSDETGYKQLYVELLQLLCKIAVRCFDVQILRRWS